MKTIYLIFLLIIPTSNIFSGVITSSSNSEIIVVGSSNLSNKDLARKHAIDDALLTVQEFLDGSIINSTSIYQDSYKSGNYSQKYISIYDKKIKGSTKLKYSIIKEWRNTDGVFNIRIRLNTGIYKKSRVIKNRFRIVELGIREISCDKLSYQSCEYLKKKFNSNYSLFINSNSPYVIGFVAKTNLIPNKKCNIDNLGGTIFISDEICMGDLNIHTTLMVYESGKKASEGEAFDVICNNINLSDISIYNGFPSIFNDSDSRKCGNKFYSSALNALNLMIKNITR